MTIVIPYMTDVTRHINALNTKPDLAPFRAGFNRLAALSLVITILGRAAPTGEYAAWNQSRPAV